MIYWVIASIWILIFIENMVSGVSRLTAGCAILMVILYSIYFALGLP